MRKVLNITKALSDSNRIRALMMLKNGELCVCQIIEALGLAPSTVSKHMSILKQAELVEARKQERWMYYRLPGRTSGKSVNEIIRWLDNNLSEDKEILKDTVHLKKIRKLKKEVLCRKTY